MTTDTKPCTRPGCPHTINTWQTFCTPCGAALHVPNHADAYAVHGRVPGVAIV